MNVASLPRGPTGYYFGSAATLHGTAVLDAYKEQSGNGLR
jgi:hypothetical protein